MPSRAPFNKIAALRPGKSVFDLSYEKKFTCDMGELIPVMCDEVVPGDIFDIGNEIVVRFQPMIAPILHEVNVNVHYFFVPYRIIWDEFEQFITGGTEGNDSTPVPTWNPTNTAKYSLWDYLGFEIDKVPTGLLPIRFPRVAYNRIYNEWFRDQTNIEEIPDSNEDILYRAYERDYFTAALPWQQRGLEQSVPLGSMSAVYEDDIVGNASGQAPVNINTAAPEFAVAAGGATTNLRAVMNDNSVKGTTFSITELRESIQVQKFLERNARAGARYVEFLQSHFGFTGFLDARLDRPEMIAATKSSVIVSEVLQTSETGASSPQGNLAGHGIVADGTYAGKYRVQEFGLIMGIMSIMPRSSYSQGIDRQWIKTSRYDFYFPEFANLSEQPVVQGEIFVTDGDQVENQTLFGYIGKDDHLRTKKNMVVADMRDTFNYWHCARRFTTAPTLSQEFLEAKPQDTPANNLKRIFAVQDEPGLIVQCLNRIRGIRPLPVVSNPGLMDHH